MIDYLKGSIVNDLESKRESIYDVDKYQAKQWCA